MPENHDSNNYGEQGDIDHEKAIANRKNGLPFYKRFPRDFLEGTAGMDWELKGPYAILLDLIYLHGAYLEDDAKYIAGHIGCSVRRWNKVRQELLNLGKIELVLRFISSRKARDLMIKSRLHQEQQRENRIGSNKNKGLQEPPTDHAESRYQNQNTESSSSSCGLQRGAHEGANFARTDDSFFFYPEEPDRPPPQWWLEGRDGKLKTRLPDDWRPPPTPRDLRLQLSLDAEDIEREQLLFADYYRSLRTGDKQAWKSNWRSCWFAWLKRGIEVRSTLYPREAELRAEDRELNEWFGFEDDI